MANELQLRLFGGLEVAVDGLLLSGFMSRKVPALLAYLVMTGRPARRDDLAALLWGEMPDVDARNNLRQALANLRGLVEPFLSITRDTVALNPGASCVVDASEFEKTVCPAPALAPDARAVRLARALDVYTGDFLSGFFVRDAPGFEEWMLGQRAHYRELALAALDTLARLHMELGEYEQAVHDITRLLAFDEWREEAHRQLMLALVRTGQRSAALAQYKRCERLLLQEFGVGPSLETVNLYERIKVSLHRPRGNLPAYVDDFVGRREELAQLTRSLAAPQTRLLTLRGQGGVGKTRLALELAAAVEPRFLDGAWFVALGAVEPAQRDGLPLAIGEALRAPRGPEPRQSVAAHLRERELLLVLDSTERLVEQTDWVADLLTAAPGVKVVVTSRERLRLHAERVIEVAGLALPRPDAPAQESEAVDLFVRRAQRVDAAFTLTSETLPDVARICRLVDGSPLAIELAAAWAQALPPGRIAMEIAANLDFLVSQHRDAVPRQRSLRATFDYSWSLLTPTEQEAYPLLSVFRGSFDVAAAAAVVGAPAPVLASLVDKSLLRYEGGRFELHDILRQFVAERASVMDRLPEAQARQAAYYTRVLAGQAGQLDGSTQAEAVEALTREHDNIRAAWSFAAQTRRLADLEAAYAPLFHYLDLRSAHAEGRDAFAAGVAATAATLDSLALAGMLTDASVARLHGRLLARQGACENRLGRHADAAATLAAAEAVARNMGDGAGIVFAVMHISYTLYTQGELGEARRLLEEIISVARGLDDDLLLADALESLAAVAGALGDYVIARGHHLESLALLRRHGDRARTIKVLTNLGSVYHWLGNYDDGRRLYEEAAGIAHELGDGRSAAICLHNLADIEYRLGAYEKAAELGAESLAIFQDVGVQMGVAHNRLLLARAYAALHHPVEASQQFHAALTMTLEMGANSLAVEVIMELGGWLARQGRPVLAVEALAFAAQHPALFDEPRRRATATLAEVAAALPASEAEAAGARGRSATLTEVARVLLTF